MFPFGIVLLLIGYSATYVGIERLRGDNRTVTGILRGANGGQLIRASDTGGGTSLAGSAVGAAVGTVTGLGKDVASGNVGGVLSDVNPSGIISKAGEGLPGVLGKISGGLNKAFGLP